MSQEQKEEDMGGCVEEDPLADDGALCVEDNGEQSSTAHEDADIESNDAVLVEDPPITPQHRRLSVRAVWFTVGILSLALGGAGIVLPGLPTTPFVLLSAYCFARSSDRFLSWLSNSRIFGPIIKEWKDHRALPSRRVKIVALSVALLCFAASIVYFALFSPWWWAAIILGAICLGVCIFLLRLPVVTDDERSGIQAEPS
mmetsp:Transcript_24683/g.54559  ORF Transcript_24683/g.54559 Transcript_24683/m.54559 type:complete len:200 (-) Transcript_24683:157-756(-)|eukprot:CAMPEP_0178598128 /NCGR_PEP_ID=MMETSP0697-20121206/32574_1 /TAXON_ID=265572 /ORGANISM="Extubocellulus spinifer, Strain CCMP396" /LENGTH=199 /DNA_ID=CAMNT_0020235869 /DNA_START=56 /DNA_END=655 /DNA_ORIENTATION=+